MTRLKRTNKSLLSWSSASPSRPRLPTVVGLYSGGSQGRLSTFEIIFRLQSGVFQPSIRD